ncbi:photosystem I reaction center subunit PsaK [Lyngbya confervoides]|uniref:Photosystem I reaction center subunit PsaK n=1 Tax=Lyngbya confervoides BDU141951 TaxID=1574623 RepID=A0ABD4T9Q8_9CYAN|nr:photosystem I reaction center subunit PsaK [Lyngbya confervoides]MCM1985032.1 photosystem I reaction center subunit PsaK [Lyngbya confervoides BDU141951]
MLTPTLLAVAVRSSNWSPTIGLIMLICNVIAIAFGKYTIKNQSTGPAMPSPNLFGGFGLGAVLGTTCFGHILGAGVILGLTNIGAI